MKTCLAGFHDIGNYPAGQPGRSSHPSLVTIVNLFLGCALGRFVKSPELQHGSHVARVLTNLLGRSPTAPWLGGKACRTAPSQRACSGPRTCSVFPVDQLAELLGNQYFIGNYFTSELPLVSSSGHISPRWEVTTQSLPGMCGQPGGALETAQVVALAAGWWPLVAPLRQRTCWVLAMQCCS